MWDMVSPRHKGNSVVVWGTRELPAVGAGSVALVERLPVGVGHGGKASWAAGFAGLGPAAGAFFVDGVLVGVDPGEALLLHLGVEAVLVAGLAEHVEAIGERFVAGLRLGVTVEAGDRVSGGEKGEGGHGSP